MNKSNNIGTLFAACVAVLFALGGMVAAIANPPSSPSPPSPPSPPPKTQATPPKSLSTKPPAFSITANPAQAKAKSNSTQPHPPAKPENEPKTQTVNKPESTAPQHIAPHSATSSHPAPVTPATLEPDALPPGTLEPDTSHAVSNPQEALALLVQGNARWVQGKVISPNTQAQRREDLAANGQTPFVTIVTCSDSRIPVERVFDRGIGDLFVIRVAGNRAASSEVGTVEYGVEHLKTPLLVVMGHSKCGAVAAAVSGAHLHGKVAELVAGIQPAVDRARKGNPGADEATLITASIKENVWQTIFDLYKTSPEVRAMAANGTLKVVGANYDISSGKVEFLGEHPWQSELFAAMNASQTLGQNAAHVSPDTHASTKHTPAHGKNTTAPQHEPAHAAAPTDDHK